MRKSHQRKLERYRAILSDMRDALDDMSGVYRDRYDNASEKWQGSDAGNACDDLRESLERAAAEVESAESTIADLTS